MAGHEYSVVGHSRSRIGSYIALISGSVAGGLTALAGLAISFLDKLGYMNIPTIIVWPLTGGGVFALLFILFDRFIWRWPRFRSLVGVPDIAGVWSLSGQTYDQDNNPTFRWSGKITITQGYEKITVHLKSAQSESKSISAAIVNEGDHGYRLIYSYRNEPKPGERELQSHIGHCELLFGPDRQTAEGIYFNGLGRVTSGTMKLTRELGNAA